MSDFVYGALAASYFIAGVFFLRFWTRTRERLLLIFALAFWMLALNQTLLGLLNLEREEESWLYMIRLASFTLIIAGIVLVNLRKR